MDKRSNEVERLLRFDKIRVSKLLELLQFAIISLILCLFIGTLIDKTMVKLFNLDKVKPEYKIKPEDKSLFRLTLESLFQFSCVILCSYYVGKLVSTVPFYFSLTDKFISNKKGEVGKGTSIGSSIIFFTLQDNLTANILEISNRIKKFEFENYRLK